MKHIFKKFSALALATVITVPLLTSCAGQPKKYPLVELSVEKDLVYGEDISQYVMFSTIQFWMAVTFSLSVVQPAVIC